MGSSPVLSGHPQISAIVDGVAEGQAQSPPYLLSVVEHFDNPMTLPTHSLHMGSRRILSFSSLLAHSFNSVSSFNFKIAFICSFGNHLT